MNSTDKETDSIRVRAGVIMNTSNISDDIPSNQDDRFALSNKFLDVLAEDRKMVKDYREKGVITKTPFNPPSKEYYQKLAENATEIDIEFDWS